MANRSSHHHQLVLIGLQGKKSSIDSMYVCRIMNLCLTLKPRYLHVPLVRKFDMEHMYSSTSTTMFENDKKIFAFQMIFKIEILCLCSFKKVSHLLHNCNSLLQYSSRQQHACLFSLRFSILQIITRRSCPRLHLVVAQCILHTKGKNYENRKGARN